MILHIILDEKFTDDFITYINEQFDINKHHFAILASQEPMRYCESSTKYSNVSVLHKSIREMVQLIYMCIKAEKIVLHSLLIRYIPFVIGFKLFARKLYVALWGGEIYNYSVCSRFQNYIKHRILSRAKGITCELKEDYEFAKIIYKMNTKYFPCMMYLSNIVDDEDSRIYETKKINEPPVVMIGNSADPRNNHYEIIDSLVKNKIVANYIIPLSYGDRVYAQDVAKYANDHLKGNIRILFDFMPLDRYLELLKTVDVVVYAHKRQQALGNTFHMIAYGTKVYIDSSTTTFAWMKRNGIIVFSSDHIDGNLSQPLTKDEMKRNSEIVSFLTSRKILKNDWAKIFED
ncbi:MAG: TDP-N-acetylfucosamine:lipid II N-acetylfucosaminyltransferase [Paludibacteraceae bacterium]|nr:TDP-N-acetylfucosamine:lipid II N-acetylfucosaminyltransferase [Paludibacteraceae bacterium]